MKPADTLERLRSLVDGLAETARASAAADARRAEQIDQLRRAAEFTVQVTTSRGMRAWSQAQTARRVTIAEVAAVLRIPDRSAETLIEESRMLVEELHRTLDGLRSGDFSYRQAKSIIDHAISLRPELRAEFEQRVIPYAATLTPSKFEQKARHVRERMDASTITERRMRALADREVLWEPARDGMGWFHWYDTAEKTRGAFERATDIAITLAAPDDDRTLTQRRADVVGDLLLDGDVKDRGQSGIRPSVVLTIPVMSLLGRSSASGELEPAILDGHGPIDIETAKQLAGNAKSWRRVLTHPVSGVILAVESRKRKIPPGLRAFLGLRDGTCRMPGCNRSVAHCDLDHIEEWQDGGAHAADNLAHLCPKHHDEKHHTPIHERLLPSGDIEWTMASGHVYVSEPAMRMDAYAA